ncbi:MAG: DUF4433 domain-containing protein [Rhodocyclaceae bacterium]|jgi:hypothetical protein|nr:DUF4433 domain-containing protein [Rhodocyclaceae bacterium]
MSNRNEFWVGFDADGEFVEDPFIRHAKVGQIWLWSARTRIFDEYPAQWAKPRLKPLDGINEQAAIDVYLAWLQTPEALPWLRQRNAQNGSSVSNAGTKEKSITAEPSSRLKEMRWELEQRFPFFYHMTHEKNIDSICRYGLLSLNRLRGMNLSFTDISLQTAQEKRDRPEPVFNRAIHEYVPFYFNPKNPMMFVRKELCTQLVLVEIDRTALIGLQFLYSDGNAASPNTRFSEDIVILHDCVDALTVDYWNDVEDGKRRRCAEILVYSQLNPQLIQRFICRDHQMAEKLQEHVGLPVVADQAMFF